jgi:hypothetical protein
MRRREAYFLVAGLARSCFPCTANVVQRFRECRGEKVSDTARMNAFTPAGTEKRDDRTG